MPDEQLVAQGVRQWSEMPLWRTFSGVWRVSSAAAQAAGPFMSSAGGDGPRHMAMDAGAPVESADERASEIGISREREQQILARVA